jgi:hypothetical protein
MLTKRMKKRHGNGRCSRSGTPEWSTGMQESIKLQFQFTELSQVSTHAF